MACGGVDPEGDLATERSYVRGRDFTAEDINAIMLELRRANPEDYLVQLPVFRGSLVVGQRTYGSMPLARVERIASSRGVRLDPGSNMLGVFAPCSGGGAGSHTPSQSAGNLLGSRIESIVNNVDTSRYQYLY